MRIRQKLITVHLLLVVLLIAGLSVRQYSNQWELALSESIAYHSNLSQRFLAPLSAAISGSNYANIYLPNFVDELRNTTTLLYLEVEGLSDDGEIYRIAYLREIGKAVRAYYPKQYKTLLGEKLRKLEQHVIDKDSDDVKINFLINRAKEELSQYQENEAYAQKIKLVLKGTSFSSEDTIDTDRWTISERYASGNRNGGVIRIIYDVTPLRDVRTNIVHAIIIEFFFALLLSVIVLYFASKWITSPVEKLTKFISSDIQSIRPHEIPALDSEDEVGKLARRFQALVSDSQSYIAEIETLSTKDALTGLYNRRFYNDIVEDEIARAARARSVISFFYIDIDHFKKYNDNYGHKKGDLALKEVAQVLKASLERKSDFCFRLGGEEFLIIVNTTAAEDAFRMAEKVRSGVAGMEIEHIASDQRGHITVSIGVACVESAYSSKPDDILHCADQALYEAKDLGRNRVVCRKFPLRLVGDHSGTMRGAG